MAITIDKDFQSKVIKECADEVFALKKPKPEDIKKLLEIMKKYEDKVYERYIHKIPVSKVEKKNEKQDLINAVRHPFSGDASFLTDYNRLLRGYHEEAEFNLEQLPYEVKMPKDIGTYYPKNPYPVDKKSYVDTQANSKFYFPQDYQPHYDKKSYYTNKPSSDIGNQQNFFMNSSEGMFDPYSSQAQGFGSPPVTNQGFRSQAGLAVSQQNFPFPLAQENNNNDDKLRKTIEMLGGINRTLPNMERSLYDNELKNIERNYRYQNQLENTSNSRLNNLLQNPMTQVYSPQFDAPSVRSASPQKGGIPALQKPGLYFSPSKRESGIPTHIDSIPEANLSNKELAERNLNSAYNPTFSSSKNMREGMLGLLNPQYNIS